VSQKHLQLLQPALLDAFGKHKIIATYLNEYSQNFKRSMRRAITRVSEEIQKDIPEQLLKNVREYAEEQANYLASLPDPDKEMKPDYYNMIPSFRDVQLEKEYETL